MDNNTPPFLNPKKFACDLIDQLADMRDATDAVHRLHHIVDEQVDLGMTPSDINALLLNLDSEFRRRATISLDCEFRRQAKKLDGMKWYLARVLAEFMASQPVHGLLH